jgi:predicted secreted Zn-dependent protease
MKLKHRKKSLKFAVLLIFSMKKNLVFLMPQAVCEDTTTKMNSLSSSQVDTFKKKITIKDFMYAKNNKKAPTAC